MWVITLHGKPATVDQIYHAEDAAISSLSTPSYRAMDQMEKASYIAYDSRTKCVARYLSMIGFTWPERFKGIDVKLYPSD